MSRAAGIRCTDRVVGAILASWRYDISGISPEMRRDYENHFAEQYVASVHTAWLSYVC